MRQRFKRFRISVQSNLHKTFLRNADYSFLKKYVRPQELEHFIAQTDIKESDLKVEKTIDDFRWPIFRSSPFDHALMKSMYSFKNIYSENINGSSAVFLTGPTKCGKSWFLRQNMLKFQNAQIKPLVFHYDMNHAKAISFDTFLLTFESMIINTLVSKN